MKVVLISNKAAPEVAAYRNRTFLGAARNSIEIIEVENLDNVWFSCVATETTRDGVEVIDIPVRLILVDNVLLVIPAID